jgi:hypothetical protein
MIVVRHSYISTQAKQRSRGVGLKEARTLAVANALSHIKYIQHRPGKDRDEGAREMFTDLGDDADAKMLRQQLRRFEGRGVVIHKLSLAPEVNTQNPKEFTREVMHQLGTEKGLDLEWWAVSHRNTDHHHVHVVVLSKDRAGQTVRFNKADYDRLKDFGDRYIERTQYADYRMAELRRQEKFKERYEERQQLLEKERQERVRSGEELPWLHKKIVREQLDSHKQWQKRQVEEPRDSFEHQGERYSKRDDYERLSGLKRQLHQNADRSKRLPADNYKLLQSWIEQKDRARFAGEPDRQLASAKEQQSKAEKARNSPAANRYVSPVQQEMMRNPVMGLFLTQASIAAAIVRAIPLTDQRDRLKENRDELESAKRDKEAKQRQRGNPDHKASDEEVIQKLDEAIEQNKNTREDGRKEKEKRKDKRDHGVDFMR